MCSGGEEGADHSADCSSAAVWHSCRGHQPLHGHLQEDGWRLRRPLRLLLHLHHLPRGPAALQLRDSLTTSGPLLAMFLLLFFFFFCNLQQSAPCVPCFSRPWSYSSWFKFVVHGWVSCDSAVKVLVSAALGAPVEVLKLTPTRECSAVVAQAGDIYKQRMWEIKSIVRLVGVGRRGAWRGNIDITSLILKKKKSLKWSKPWQHLTAQRVCALNKVLGEAFKGPVEHFKESIGKKWNLRKLVESIAFLFTNNEHLCFHKEQWGHWRGQTHIYFSPACAYVQDFLICTLKSQLMWERYHMWD